MADTERDDDSGKVERRAIWRLENANSWAKLLTNYGLTAALLVGLLWYVVIPLKDAHLQFLKDQTLATSQLVEVSTQQAELMRDNNDRVAEMVDEQQAQRATLERISGTLLRTERVISDPDTH